MTGFLARFLAAALCCWSIGAAAADTGAQQLPPALTVLMQRSGLTVLKQFKTDVPDMTGYVLKNRSGKTGLLFTFHGFVLSGSIYDVTGANLADKYADAELPKPDYAGAAKALAADRTLLVEGGKNAPVMYVFADPNCIYCHKFWQLTRNWVEQGKVQIHWVMVGFLKPSSPGRAAAMMAAKDGAKAIADDQVGFDAAHEEGSIAELKPIPHNLQVALQQHSALMESLQFQGTPALLFKNKAGHWEGIPGMPSLSQLADAMGIQP